MGLFDRFRKKEPEAERQVEQKIDHSVERTRENWFGRVKAVFERSTIEEDLWDELEELLIRADVGVATTDLLINRVKDRVQSDRLKTPEQARRALQDEMVQVLSLDNDGRAPASSTTSRLLGSNGENQANPTVVLVIGVNGVGKTTTIAKLAKELRDDGQRVILAAGDTFRAAAIDQLVVWGERIGVDVVAHKPGADPGAVVYDAMLAAQGRHADVLIIDTAGRLHTKFNLMEELKKIRRVLTKVDPTAPHEVLLVLDATTGQNGLSQAKHFTDAVGVTGIILAKLDGTAKGGIVFAITKELGIPIKFIGTGETADDLAPFDPQTYVDALFA